MLYYIYHLSNVRDGAGSSLAMSLATIGDSSINDNNPALDPRRDSLRPTRRELLTRIVDAASFGPLHPGQSHPFPDHHSRQTQSALFLCGGSRRESDVVELFLRGGQDLRFAVGFGIHNRSVVGSR